MRGKHIKDREKVQDKKVQEQLLLLLPRLVKSLQNGARSSNKILEQTGPRNKNE